MSAAELLLVFLISYSVCGGYEAARCAVPRLPNGRARPRQAGQLLKFTCQPGYMLVGNRYAYCRAGRWDVSLPVCVKSGCSPVTVENSIQVPLHEGAWVYFFCMPGYRHDGPAVIYCNGRTWNGTAPTCIVAAAAAPGQLGCDFESGLCGWAQDELHDFDWKRWSGRTPSAFMFTGPSHDHTHGPLGTGSYVYLEATSRLENDTARLLSPVYHADLASKGCFSFFYHMFGKSIGGLRVYQKPTSVGLPELLALSGEARRRYLLFELWGDQGDAWYGAVADLTDFNENFQIVIEGVRGASFTSDIAVDDVAMLRGEQCAAARARAPTPPPYDVESCSGRCEVAGSTTVRRVGACGCSASCLADDDCCPDYFDLCGFAVTDTSSEYSLTNTSDIDGGRLPDKQPLVASTASSRDTTTTSTSTKTVPITKPTTVATTTSTAATTTSTAATTTSTAATTTSTATTPPVTTTVSTKATPNTTAVRRFTTSTLRSTTKQTVNVTRVSVLPAIRRTATAPATPSTTTVRPTTVSRQTVRPTAVKPNTTAADAATFTRPPLPPRSLPQMKTQKNKDKAASTGGGSALRIALAVLGVLALCGVAGLVLLRARTARGPTMLARMRARATRDPEVRFLTSNVDE